MRGPMLKRNLLPILLAASLTAAFGPAAAGAEAASGENAGGVCYEVFVYSFEDSDGDGIGDLKGLREKLDYINDGDDEGGEDLECDMIWLMPVFSSPTYHKYDVTDYLSIDRQYGSMEDFDELLLACHERGVRLILDLPVNHTSVSHPWFEEAAAYVRSLGPEEEISYEDCPLAGWYHFTRESGNGYALLEGTDWYYEARFWEGMPDLNLDEPAVRDEIAKIADFWLDKGVDGFRLDAVTSYYTEDQAASISFLSWFVDRVKSVRPDVYLVGEAWTDFDTYTRYYESGIDSMFDFAFSGQEGVITRVARGKKPAAWYGEKLVQEEALFDSLPGTVINAPFYTNHDMARSAGYYTRDDGSRTKLAEALNLLMPGRAFLYYGEELGMKGSGIDENKRAPMYWSTDPEAPGMCQGPPGMEEVKMKFGSLEEQETDPASILAYVRSAIAIRSRFPVIACGKTRLVADLSGDDLCVLIREDGNGRAVMLAVNTSEEERMADLSGEECRGFGVLAGQLTVSEEEASMEGSVLRLPAFGIAVLTVE